MASSTHTIQSSISAYGDHVRSRYPELFVHGGPGSSQLYWLQQVLNPLQQSACSALPDCSGISLIGFSGGRPFLAWSTCFKYTGNNLVYRRPDESQLATTAEDLQHEISDLCATSEFQIFVLHCLPRGSGGSPLTWYSKTENVIDVIGARLDLDPRLFIAHFDGLMESHEPVAQALPSERTYVRLEHPDGGHVTASSGNANHCGASMAVVIDSSIQANTRYHYHFLPLARSSYMETTFDSFRGGNVTVHSLYHLKGYLEHILRASMATIKNSHRCTDIGCRAMPQTWKELETLSQLLRTNYRDIQHILNKEELTHNAPLPESLVRLLADVNMVAEMAALHTASIERQAQLQSSDLAVTEAQETYKQARSMERLTTIAWIYIPLSFSATFFGMNVAQLNDSGPNIGYFFLLLIVSLLIGAAAAILYTDWWHGVAFSWRERVEPGHSCHPRSVSIPHLLWVTLQWPFREAFSGLRARLRKVSRTKRVN